MINKLLISNIGEKPKASTLFWDLTVFMFLDFADFLIILALLLSLLLISIPISSLASYRLLTIDKLLLSIKVSRVAIMLKRWMKQ